MSMTRDCPDCMFGDHSRHVGPWNVREGLLGGAVCCCAGDCAVRAQAAFMSFREQYAAALSPTASGGAE